MHTYSTDSTERRLIPFILAVLAILTARAVDPLVTQLAIWPQWWYSPAVDTMAFYGLWYFLFDRLLWRLPLLKWIGLVRVPNLSGSWQGIASPTQTAGVSEGHQKDAKIHVRIRHTWSLISITAETEGSDSFSRTATLVVGDSPSLSYEYYNQPKASAPDTMHPHPGMTHLNIKNLGQVLEGDYYSGRSRQNIGTLRLTRQE